MSSTFDADHWWMNAVGVEADDAMVTAAAGLRRAGGDAYQDRRPLALSVGASRLGGRAGLRWSTLVGEGRVAVVRRATRACNPLRACRDLRGALADSSRRPHVLTRRTAVGIGVVLRAATDSRRRSTDRCWSRTCSAPQTGAVETAVQWRRLRFDHDRRYRHLSPVCHGSFAAQSGRVAARRFGSARRSVALRGSRLRRHLHLDRIVATGRSPRPVSASVSSPRPSRPAWASSPSSSSTPSRASPGCW